MSEEKRPVLSLKRKPAENSTAPAEATPVPGVVRRKKGHCCKVSDEAAFCLIQRPYISKTLLTRRISPRGSP
ncbi:TPA: hypothetical protein MCZ18_005489 [Klebsiella pneumoniae]|nr:hypothetical protein [Klebsiella pneumoniae]